ncbi:MAG: hypothetical protein KBT07_08385 [Clostridiales bacterium]|nr:hypothetical protein [Candidatus Scatonaster coprocaballi]
MKKFFVAAMAAVMMFSAAACTKVNKEFKKTTDNLTSAVKSVCDASKASSYQIKAFKDGTVTSKPATFTEGAYYTCEKKDVKVSDLGSKVIEPGQMTDIYMFCKCDQNTEATSTFVAQVVALKNEELAGKYFEEVVADMSDGMTEDDLKQYAAALEGQYAFVNDENECVLALVVDAMDVASITYVKLEGTQVIEIVYDGTSSSTLLSEFYDVMNEMNYADVKASLHS